MNRPVPKVGQKLWSVPRDRREGRPEWVEVSRVGKKYFYVGRGERRHQLFNWGHDSPSGYSARYTLYESEKEWTDLQRAVKIAKAIAEELRYGSAGGRSLEQLEQAAKILEVEVDDSANI